MPDMIGTPTSPIEIEPLLTKNGDVMCKVSSKQWDFWLGDTKVHHGDTVWLEGDRLPFDLPPIRLVKYHANP